MTMSVGMHLSVTGKRDEMEIKTVEFTGIDALLILKVGGHKLHIRYDNGYRFDHEFLFVSEHLKDGRMVGLTEVDFTALKRGCDK